jgi:hypothetical protein
MEILGQAAEEPPLRLFGLRGPKSMRCERFVKASPGVHSAAESVGASRDPRSRKMQNTEEIQWAGKDSRREDLP